MLNYTKLAKQPAKFKQFTGLNIEEFQTIYGKIKKTYDEFEIKRLSNRKRKRAVGAGRKFRLDLANRLLMLLVYYRLYMGFSLMEFLFDLNQSNVWRDIKYLEPLVSQCIPLPKKMKERTKRINTLKELLEYYPGMKEFVDATEQEIPRPKNKRKRKKYYSGKKKRHAVKTQIVVNKDGIILDNSGHHEGKKHDYSVFKKEPPDVPKGVELGGDLGYKGMKKDYPEMKTKIPYKKPKDGKLSKKQKRFNKKFSKERIVVEHTIRKIKEFKIIGNEYRNELKNYDSSFSIAAGLVNFITMQRNNINLPY